MDPDDRARFDLLSQRVQALEDERAIHNTLTRYGFGVDSDDPDGTANLYAEDCVLDIDNVVFMHGRGEVRDKGETRIWRQAFGRWQLERRDGRWPIVRRTSRAVGSVDAQRLLNQGL